MEWWNAITDLTFGSGGVLVVPPSACTGHLSTSSRTRGYFASRSNGIMDNEDLPPSSMFCLIAWLKIIPEGDI